MMAVVQTVFHKTRKIKTGCGDETVSRFVLINPQFDLSNYLTSSSVPLTIALTAFSSMPPLAAAKLYTTFLSL